MTRRTSFGLLGLLLSTGAPVGLLLLRLATSRAEIGALGQEWTREWPTYLYIALSTSVAFTAFGATLGHGADKLLRLATRDGLTGLLNRGALAQRLDIETRRAQRYGQALSVVLLDVDRLKSINDRYGHGAGDDTLRRIGEAITSACRSTDIAGRWGGDEFLVLAPSTVLADARLLGDRIQQAVRALDAPPSTAVSVGVASAEAGALPEQFEQLLRTADDLLYVAKRAGRDQMAEDGRLPEPAG
jgi:two-component system, cell cycle response regulator